MKARVWLSHPLSLILLAAVLGCGSPKQPEEMIFVSMVTTGDPAQRDVRIIPDLDGASIDIWEFKEAVDPSAKKKKEPPPTSSARMSKADYVALWKGFPKGHIWTIHDMKADGSAKAAPTYTIELIRSGRHVKAVIEAPEQQAEKSPWQMIESILKAASVSK